MCRGERDALLENLKGLLFIVRAPVSLPVNADREADGGRHFSCKLHSALFTRMFFFRLPIANHTKTIIFEI